MENSRQLAVFAPIAEEVFNTWPSLQGGTAAVYADLANTTDPSKGAALVGYKHGAANTTPRNVTTKMQDIVSVKDFGAVGNGSADDGPAINNAIAWAAANNASVYFPAGNYLSYSVITFNNCRSVNLLGAGRNVTFLSWAFGSAGAGLTFNMLDWSQQLKITDMTFHTGSNSVGVAILARWPASGGVSVPAAHIENVEIGAPAGLGARFNVGIQLEHAYMSTIRNCIIRGTGHGAPNFIGMNRGIALTGTSTDTKISDTHIFFCNRGIHVQDFCEGLNVYACYIIYCREGIVLEDGNSAPSFFCSHMHISAFDLGIYIVNRAQCMVTNCLIYQDLGSTAPTFNGITVTGDGAIGNIIQGNYIYAGAPSSPNRVGIRVDGPSTTVFGNNFLSATTPIQVTARGNNDYLVFGQR